MENINKFFIKHFNAKRNQIENEANDFCEDINGVITVQKLKDWINEKYKYNIFEANLNEGLIAYSDSIQNNIVLNKLYLSDNKKIDVNYILLHEIYHVINNEFAPMKYIKGEVTLLKTELADYFAYFILKKFRSEDKIPKKIKELFNYLEEQNND
ncbi:MAG: hypothetical protein HRT99_03740 [Mycoplasmatales bacterium]|nr:hypothetical protein [Mycoplasmatales bacterium]